LKELRAFVSGDHQAFVLVTAWLVGALRPRGPYPVLEVVGEQGSGKSTLARVLRTLVDPHEAALRRPPREERDLYVAARNSWVLIFDNLSGLSQHLSDALCVLATGGGFSARKLYTDEDETLLTAQRPVIITGISDVAQQPDLRDRVLRVELDALRSLKDEESLRGELEAASPRILGALLDAVAAALKYWPKARLDRAPRMVDFSRWVTAAELGGALPWPPGEFLRVYTGHREALATVVLEDPVAAAVLELVERRGSWAGTATDLLGELEGLTSERVARARTWPRTPNALAARLRRLAPELRRAAGVEVAFERTGRRRLLRVGPEQPRKPSSPSSPSSPPGRGTHFPRVPAPGGGDDGGDGPGAVVTTAGGGSSPDPGPKSLVPQGFPGGGDGGDDGDDLLYRHSGFSPAEPRETAVADGARGTEQVAVLVLQRGFRKPPEELGPWILRREELPEGVVEWHIPVDPPANS
jgi:energy-coupling factor transporter ATP-binding protein EcfA2